MKKQRTTREVGKIPTSSTDGLPSPRRSGQPHTDGRDGGGHGSGRAGKDGASCETVRAFLADASQFTCRQRAALAAHARDCDRCFLLALDQFIAELPADLRTDAPPTGAGSDGP
jgi:hypothetical protein